MLRFTYVAGHHYLAMTCQQQLLPFITSTICSISVLLFKARKGKLKESTKP